MGTSWLSSVSVASLALVKSAFLVSPINCSLLSNNRYALRGMRIFHSPSFAFRKFVMTQFCSPLPSLVMPSPNTSSLV